MNHRINIKCTTIKLQRKYPQDPGLGKELLAMTQKHDPKKGKTDELDLCSTTKKKQNKTTQMNKTTTIKKWKDKL